MYLIFFDEKKDNSFAGLKKIFYFCKTKFLFSHPHFINLISSLQILFIKYFTESYREIMLVLASPFQLMFLTSVRD